MSLLARREDFCHKQDRKCEKPHNAPAPQFGLVAQFELVAPPAFIVAPDTGPAIPTLPQVVLICVSAPESFFGGKKYTNAVHSPAMTTTPPPPRQARRSRLPLERMSFQNTPIETPPLEWLSGCNATKSQSRISAIGLIAVSAQGSCFSQNWQFLSRFPV